MRPYCFADAKKHCICELHCCEVKPRRHKISKHWFKMVAVCCQQLKYMAVIIDLLQVNKS